MKEKEIKDNKKMSPEQFASVIMQEYREGLKYQQQMNFASNWVMYQDFKEGRQWSNPTRKTKNLPRPVYNMIKFIINHKISSVLNENVKMVFSPEELPDEEMAEGDVQEGDEELLTAAEGADKYTRFSEATWESLRQDKLNDMLLDDAATLGTMIVHYFWDNNKTGGITKKYKGSMCGEVIDPYNFFVGNPQCSDVQKQPYVLISSREIVDNVKELAKKNGLKPEEIALIKPDKSTNDEGYESARLESDTMVKTTVLTKYWKKDGRVYFTKVSNNVVVQEKTDTGLKLYPIASMQWELRKKSIFGLSEVEGLIPNQKAINFLMGMMTLSVQNTAWPKMLVKEGALKQQPTNVPGEVIVDSSGIGMDGIKYMMPGQISQYAPLLVDKTVDMTRMVTGATEVATGEPFSKDLNASAIIALQNAAKVPIETIRKRYYRFIEDIGRIWEEFFKNKYNTERRVTVKNSDNEEVSMSFRGTDYEKYPMRLKIDVGASSSFSESLSTASLDRFLNSGLISFEQYLKYAPKNAVPFKDMLLREIEQQKEREASPMPGMPGAVPAQSPPQAPPAMGAPQELPTEEEVLPTAPDVV